MKLISSWDDGHQLDFKISDLLKENADFWDKHIFFIPNSCSLNESQIKDLSEDFSVGGHTVSHPPDIKKLDRDQIKSEILSNKEWLENIADEEIKWFCYPSGRYNEEVKEVVKECGFEVARTVDIMNIEEPKDKMETGTSIHVFPGRDGYEKHWLEHAKKLFKKAKKKDGVYHIWGHSWEIEENQQWEELEELLKFIKQSMGDA